MYFIISCKDHKGVTFYRTFEEARGEFVWQPFKSRATYHNETELDAYMQRIRNPYLCMAIGESINIERIS